VSRRRFGLKEEYLWQKENSSILTLYWNTNIRDIVGEAGEDMNTRDDKNNMNNMSSKGFPNKDGNKLDMASEADTPNSPTPANAAFDDVPSTPATAAFGDVTLDCGGEKSMSTVLFYPVSCVATPNCLVTTNAGDGKVYSFRTNNNNNNADVVVSADRGGKIYSWDARTLEIVSEWQIEDAPRVLYLMNLTHGSILVATTSTSSGNVAQHLYVFSHNKGRHLSPLRDLKLKPRGIPFGACDGNFCVKTLMKAYKMDTEGQHRDALAHPMVPAQYNYEFFGAFDRNYIVLSYSNERMFVYRNVGVNKIGCPLIATIPIDSFMERLHESLRAVTIISSDLLMVTTEKFGVYFLNLQGVVQAKIAVTKSADLRNACVLADGRICVVGADAYCGVWPCPTEVKGLVGSFAQKMKPDKGDGDGDIPLSVVKKAEAQPASINVNTRMNGSTGNNNSATLSNQGSSVGAGATSDERAKYGFREHLAKQKKAAEKKQTLIEVKASHAAEIARLEHRAAANGAAHRAELMLLRKKFAAEKSQLQLVNGSLKADGEDWKRKYTECAAEKDRYAKYLEEGQARWDSKLTDDAQETVPKIDSTRESMQELKELKLQLESERKKSRKYKSELNIQNINMTAQLEIQKIKLQECEEDLRLQKKKAEMAEIELNRIRELDLFGHASGCDNTGKKRKLN